MGADWSGMESALKKWFNDVGMVGSGDIKEPNKDNGKTAGKIADEYEKAMKKGMEMYGNKTDSFNPSAVKKAFKGAFDMLDADKTGAMKSAAGAMMGAGFVACWAGGTMKKSVPPPPSISVVSNVVMSPGAPIPVSIGGPTDDTGAFAGAIVNAAKSHAATVAGLCTSKTPAPGPTTPPMPYPWVGIF